MRVRTMAAFTLGEIGDRRALGVLQQRMENHDDARVQLAAAKAILMILNKTPTAVATR
jgi:HEAT repeat protein